MLLDCLPVDLRPALRAEVEPSEVRAVAAVCVLLECVLLRVEALVVSKQRIGAQAPVEFLLAFDVLLKPC